MASSEPLLLNTYGFEIWDGGRIMKAQGSGRKVKVIF